MITKEIKAHIEVLDLPLLDTTVNNRDFTGTFIADIVLQIYLMWRKRNVWTSSSGRQRVSSLPKNTTILS